MPFLQIPLQAAHAHDIESTPPLVGESFSDIVDHEPHALGRLRERIGGDVEADEFLLFRFFVRVVFEGGEVVEAFDERVEPEDGVRADGGDFGKGGEGGDGWVEGGWVAGEVAGELVVGGRGGGRLG